MANYLISLYYKIVAAIIHTGFHYFDTVWPCSSQQFTNKQMLN